MQTQQSTFTLPPYPRGFHLITAEVERRLPWLRQTTMGLAHVFIHHTSAGLTLNENADPTVRLDFESHFNLLVPENAPHFLHNDEGPDDMPAHIKAALLGSSVSVPVRNGRFLLGTWQGIYLCEHRNRGGSRTITVTFLGN